MKAIDGRKVSRGRMRRSAFSVSRPYEEAPWRWKGQDERVGSMSTGTYQRLLLPDRELLGGYGWPDVDGHGGYVVA